MTNHRNQNHKTTPKSLERIIPNENHTFWQDGATSRKEDIKKHKHDGNITQTFSKNGITKRLQKLMPPKSQKRSQNDHEMVAKYHKNHQTKNDIITTCQKTTSPGLPELLKIKLKTKGDGFAQQ